MHQIEQLPKPIIFAHRGASRYAPENTIYAFERAISLGAAAIELDCMLSKDGIPVVIHDHTLERTTNGNGRVDEHTANDLLRLDAGSHFSEEFKGEKVPLLEEVLQRFGRHLLINIEMKNGHAPFNALVPVVVELVMRLEMTDSVLFSSFNPLNLVQLKKRLPTACVALLVDESFIGRKLASPAFQMVSPEYINPSRAFITQDFIAKEHARGRQMNVWTVNDAQEASRFVEWGVDGLITDDPQILTAIP